jgi:hypothetical protein
MKTPTSAAAGTSAETREPESTVTRPEAPSWYQSMWFAVLLAAVAGFSYALLVMGPTPLNPKNVNWVAFDPAYHYIGWELYRQDPHVHWPITYTDGLGYPKGESVALLDLNPLMAVVLKPLSPLLPEPSQYFGIEVILACGLQFYFAYRLLLLLIGPNVLGAALGSAFFLLAPPLNYRFWGHYSLSNQWVLIAALFVFAQAQQRWPDGLKPDGAKKDGPGRGPEGPHYPSHDRAVRRFWISAAVLAAISVGINPYLAFEVLLVLIAGVISLLWQKRITLAQSAGVAALLLAAGFVVAYSMGLVISGGKGYASGGYRDLSMNLVAPVDPRTFTSLIFPRLRGASPGQYEGYNYLGAGVLILLAIVVIAALLHKGKLRHPDKRWLVPLSLCCLLLTLLALSTKITGGDHTLIDLDPQQHFSKLFAPLRATGRLFWAPYYAILTAILAAPFLFFRKLWANVLLAALLVLQFADTRSLRQWVRTTISEDHPSPLKSPVWAQLGSLHQNLIVLPAWQCVKNASPGGPEGYRFFGFLAIQDKMRINSYQSARYTGVAQDYHCTEAAEELARQPLSPDSAYVVTPELAETIARGPSGAGKCHDVDNFILCSTKTDFGLSPTLMTAEERVENSVANPGLEDGKVAPWSNNGVEATASAAHAHSGTYSLAETGAGTVYQDINGLQPGAAYTLSAWVSCSPGAPTSAQLTIYNPTDNSAVSSPPLTCDPTWQLLSTSFFVGGEGAVRIHLVRGPGTGIVYWDDIHISGKEAR